MKFSSHNAAYLKASKAVEEQADQLGSHGGGVGSELVSPSSCAPSVSCCIFPALPPTLAIVWDSAGCLLKGWVEVFLPTSDWPLGGGFAYFTLLFRGLWNWLLGGCADMICFGYCIRSGLGSSSALGDKKSSRIRPWAALPEVRNVDRLAGLFLLLFPPNHVALEGGGRV